MKRDSRLYIFLIATALTLCGCQIADRLWTAFLALIAFVIVCVAGLWLIFGAAGIFAYFFRGPSKTRMVLAWLFGTPAIGLELVLGVRAFNPAAAPLHGPYLWVPWMLLPASIWPIAEVCKALDYETGFNQGTLGRAIVISWGALSTLGVLWVHWHTIHRTPFAPTPPPWAGTGAAATPAASDSATAEAPVVLPPLLDVRIGLASGALTADGRLFGWSQGGSGIELGSGFRAMAASGEIVCGLDGAGAIQCFRFFGGKVVARGTVQSDKPFRTVALDQRVVCGVGEDAVGRCATLTSGDPLIETTTKIGVGPIVDISPTIQGVVVVTRAGVGIRVDSGSSYVETSGVTAVVTNFLQACYSTKRKTMECAASAAPVRVGKVTDVVAVAMSESNRCALTKKGTVHCARLGELERELELPGPAKAITGTDAAVCIRLESNVMRCVWGSEAIAPTIPALGAPN